jgi:hypothetical protein
MIFRDIFADGKPDRPRPGDRLIYDQKNGTLSLYRIDADLTFGVEGETAPVSRTFVGLDWSIAHTKAIAELFAKLGQLEGEVVHIEGSFPTLVTFEVVR